MFLDCGFKCTCKSTNNNLCFSCKKANFVLSIKIEITNAEIYLEMFSVNRRNSEMELFQDSIKSAIRDVNRFTNALIERDKNAN